MPESRSHRRANGRLAFAAAGVGIVLLLSGCVDSPVPTATPSATEIAEPIFASDEEALAAAEAAYERYNSASDEVAAEGGSDPSRVDPTVTADFADTVRREFFALSEAGLTIVGDTLIEDASLAESSYDEDGARVAIYFCRDVSAVRVIGPDDSDVTPDDRDNRTPTQAFLVSSAADPSILIVDGVELWPGEDFC